jgi:hypothetical protein
VFSEEIYARMNETAVAVSRSFSPEQIILMQRIAPLQAEPRG